MATKGINLDLLWKDFNRREAWLVWGFLSNCTNHNNQVSTTNDGFKKSTSWTFRCENNISPLWFGRRHLYALVRGVHSIRKRESGLQTEEKLVWPKTSSKVVVQKV